MITLRADVLPSLCDALNQNVLESRVHTFCLVSSVGVVYSCAIMLHGNGEIGTSVALEMRSDPGSRAVGLGTRSGN